jgi:uncharacterized membrane protein
VREKQWCVGAVLSLACLALLTAAPPTAAAGDGVVRAVLFSSPTCPHCRKVRDELLPPLRDRFGAHLDVLVLSTFTPTGRDLYWAAVRRFNVPRPGVPLLVVGDVALLGSYEIPQRLPALVARYLEEGGVDWPDIPGLAGALTAAGASSPAGPASATAAAGEAVEGPHLAVPSPTPSPPLAVVAPGTPVGPAGAREEAAPSLLDRLNNDPQGNGLAILVLAGMTVAFVRSVTVLRLRSLPGRAPRAYGLYPVLAVAGLAVAAYMAHVELYATEAVCGPVGDCNTVQHSEYARLFGVVPVGVLGVAGFAAILLAWVTHRWASGCIAAWATITLLGLTGFGTVFSIYLTFLEPFVIGATCLWCLSSAVIMTALYGLALAPGREAAAWLRQLPAPGLSRRAT